MPAVNIVRFFVHVALLVGAAAAKSDSNSKYPWTSGSMHVAVVACGEDRLEETLQMIKSACLFSIKPLHFHVFADDELRPQFKERLTTFRDKIIKKFEFTIYPIQFPSDVDANEWKKLFKLCATQRIFIPSLVDANAVPGLLYVDTDILFLRPVDHVWDHFKRFNRTQIAAVTPEHESDTAGWYNRFARHPYYGELGVNSGVMLMDVKGLEGAQWEDHMKKYFNVYRYNTTWGDQDLINIFFHYYPEKLYVYPCHWNYRADHCMYMSVCKEAETHGVYILHGNRKYFHNDKQPAFKAVYEAFRDFEFGDVDAIESVLIPAIKKNLKDSPDSSCKQVSYIFTQGMERYVRLMKKNNERNKGTTKTEL